MAKYVEVESLYGHIVNNESLICAQPDATDDIRFGAAARQHEILDILDKEPAADVVEVVRCKDCEHCRWLFDKRPLCLAGQAWMPITENDFCVWGKKRANNG